MRISPMYYLMFVLTAAHAPVAVAQMAKVNGTAIPQARADVLLQDAIAQGRPESAELRDAVKKRLIESEVIAQEAVRMGLQKNAEIAARLDLARQQVLIGAYINEMAKRSPATEDAMRKALERLKDNPAANEYKARHILVASEKEAQDIIAQLKAGADFAKLAAEKSRDEGTKAQGGELQWSVPNGYVRPFAEAMARLKKGTMTETPVQTNFGWHVIRLDDIRPVPYETLKPQLQQIVQRENVQKIVDDLRAKAKIE